MNLLYGEARKVENCCILALYAKNKSVQVL